MNRRDFLKGAAAASALSGASLPMVHAAGSDEVRVALVGCGGRGTGAAADALSTQSKLGPIKLVATADLNAGKMKRTLDQLPAVRFVEEPARLPREAGDGGRPHEQADADARGRGG
jgi:hypothetical protein